MEWIRRYGTGLAVLALSLVAGWMIYQKLHPGTLPENLIMGVGRIDGDLLNLNTKYPARVNVQKAREGLSIRKGQLIAELAAKEEEAKLAQIEAEVAAKEKELAVQKTELAIARQTIPLALVRAHAALKARKAALEGVERELAALEHVTAQDERERNRTADLYGRKLIQKELLEKAELKYRIDLEKLKGLKTKRTGALSAIEAAQADLREARARQKKLETLAASLQAARDGVSAARAARDEIKAVIAEMHLHSPIDGIVIEKIAEAGEVVGAGMPVATLLDPRTLYLKIYIDTLENGKIKLGDKAVIFLDAHPDTPIPAKVIRIAQKAEFTPKEVSVRSDRIQRVFAVDLKPLTPDPLLKLGLPAIGVISLKGGKLPRSLRELPPL